MQNSSFVQKFKKIITYDERLSVIVIAFLLRFILGMIFFGSIDTITAISYDKYRLAGQVLKTNPHIPFMDFVNTFGGVLTLTLPLPLTIFHKLAGILFDSFLAGLVYDIVKTRNPEMSFKSGLLYALSPVAIILTCCHGQWDSLCLFFLILGFYIRDFYPDSAKKYFWFGILFGLSFMPKTMTLMYLLIFFTPLFHIKKIGLKQYVINQLCSLSGLATSVVVCFGFLKSYGFSINEIIKNILGYNKGGIQILGLPFAKGIEQIINLPHDRSWIIVFAGIIAIFYYFGKLKSLDVILLVYTFSFGVAGLSPQYLIWVVSLLLILNYYKYSAMYNLVASLFLTFYYVNPFSSYMPWENMVAYAPLKAFSWLTPPVIFTDPFFLSVIKFLGDYLFPICALIITIGLVINLLKGRLSLENEDLAFAKAHVTHKEHKTQREHKGQKARAEHKELAKRAERREATHHAHLKTDDVKSGGLKGGNDIREFQHTTFSVTKNLYIVFALLYIAVVSITLMFGIHNMNLVNKFDSVIAEKQKAYDILSYQGHIIGLNKDIQPFNIIFILIAWGFLWTIGAYLVQRKMTVIKK